MGSGTEAHEDVAVPIGRLLASRGTDLLTGGGAGVMAAVSRAFAETPGRTGHVVGILPGHPPPAGYPNTWVEIAIRTHLPDRGAAGTSERSRNHVNVLSSDAIVALPGGAGTRSEIALARRYARPLVAYGAAWAAVGLPPDVRLAASLDEVGAFLDAVLGTTR
jgi:uncharacterized protein (TIGR00725 family)